jgi:hypothetical protein
MFEVFAFLAMLRPSSRAPVALVTLRMAGYTCAVFGYSIFVVSAFLTIVG